MKAKFTMPGRPSRITLHPGDAALVLSPDGLPTVYLPVTDKTLDEPVNDGVFYLTAIAVRMNDSRFRKRLTRWMNKKIVEVGEEE